MPKSSHASTSATAHLNAATNDDEEDGDEEEEEDGDEEYRTAATKKISPAESPTLSRSTRSSKGVEELKFACPFCALKLSSSVACQQHIAVDHPDDEEDEEQKDFVHQLNGYDGPVHVE